MTSRESLGKDTGANEVRFDVFEGSRLQLLPLFNEADDSTLAINEYFQAGEVVVARRRENIIGLIQMIPSNTDWEVKSVAVVQHERSRGIGTALVKAALERAFTSGARRVLVSTATADIGNLRFYQRLGFRMDRIERDAFTPELGYSGLFVDGIPVRDRVWFSLPHQEFTI